MGERGVVNQYLSFLHDFTLRSREHPRGIVSGFFLRKMKRKSRVYQKINVNCFISGYTHNPYNGVVCNDTILATGVFSSKELWRLSKGKSKKKN